MTLKVKYKVIAKVYKEQGDIDYEDVLETPNAAMAMSQVREHLMTVHTDVEDSDIVIEKCFPVYD